MQDTPHLEQAKRRAGVILCSVCGFQVAVETLASRDPLDSSPKDLFLASFSMMICPC